MNSDNLHQSPLVDLYPDDPPLMEFGGWEMPRDFGGIVQEHNTVREDCGVFDLSHMGRLVLTGDNATEEIDALFSRSCEQGEDGQALYGFFCNEEGGCLDDAILYRKSSREIWMVVNAANRTRIIEWIRDHLVDSRLEDRTFETVLLALQGPNAPRIMDQLQVPSLPETPFRTNWEGPTMIASTGYTGEAGGELWLEKNDGRTVFNQILEQDLTLCGLGARDTLRLEKGFPLHGHELSESIDPITAGFDQFFDWDHEFIGRSTLDRLRQDGPSEKIIGIMTSDRQSPREGYPLRDNSESEVGTVTSGGFSPTLGNGIGMARVNADLSDSEPLEMQLRGDWTEVEQTSIPFV